MPVVAGEGEGGAGKDGASIEGQSLRDSGRGERASFQAACVREVSPHEDDQQGDKEQEGGGMRVKEQMFEKVFGQGAEETLRETKSRESGSAPGQEGRGECSGVGVRIV